MEEYLLYFRIGHIFIIIICLFIPIIYFVKFSNIMYYRITKPLNLLILFL